jgi:hypothetical protein
MSDEKKVKIKKVIGVKNVKNAKNVVSKTALSKKKTAESHHAKVVLSWFVIIIFIGILVLGFWYAFFYQSFKNTFISCDVECVLQEVNKIFILPDDETPVVVEITNPDYTKQFSNFYANIKEGDQVLFYRVSNKMIIYRPSEK